MKEISDYAAEQLLLYLYLTLKPEIINLPWRKSLDLKASQKEANKITDIIQKTIPFINSLPVLKNLLILNKNFKKRFTNKIYFQASVIINFSDMKKLVSLWTLLLKINTLQSDYESLKLKINELPSEACDNIESEMNKSYESCKSIINVSGLISVLKSYLLKNKEINYRESIGFLTGFLLIVFKEELLTFECLNNLISNCMLTKLYITNTPMLKEEVYILNRIANFILPNLSSHFKVE